MRRALTGLVAGVLCLVLVLVGFEARADEGALPAEAAKARGEIDTALSQMKAVALRVRDDLRVTRKRGTKVQIACVDDALSRADVAMRRARETGGEALAAYTRGDLETARTALHRMSELRQSQWKAARDGASCSAAPAAAAPPSGTTVTVDVDPRIPRIL